MKLFVIAALIAVSAAGRLEHLEHQQNLREYLPPDHGSGFGPHNHAGSPHGSFGGHTGSHGSHGGHSGSHGSFGAIAGAYGTNDHPSAHAHAGHPSAHAHAGHPGAHDVDAFPSASNQYLAPGHGPSASASADHSQFGGSAHGFGAHNPQNGHHHHSAPQVTPIHQFQPSDAAPQGTNAFESHARFQHPHSAGSHQHPGPHAHSSQNGPQQAFDEQTGYHY